MILATLATYIDRDTNTELEYPLLIKVMIVSFNSNKTCTCLHENGILHTHPIDMLTVLYPELIFGNKNIN